MAAEVPEHAFLDGLLEFLPVARFELRGPVKLYTTLVGLREDPGEDDEMVVEVNVEA